MPASPLARPAQPGWGDYELLLQIARAGSISAAAAQLQRTPGSLSRQLVKLERSFGTTLFDRHPTGLRLTESGRRALHTAERIEAALPAHDPKPDSPLQQLRVTAVPWLINHWLIPAMPETGWPGIALSLIAEGRDLHLGRNEADFALRFSRPLGDPAARCRRLGTVRYAGYVRRDAPSDRWIGQSSARAELPQQRALQRMGLPDPALDCSDGESVLAAVRAGRGRALLPVPLARDDRALAPCDSGPTAKRELWLMTRAGLPATAATRSIRDWLGETISARLG